MGTGEWRASRKTITPLSAILALPWMDYLLDLGWPNRLSTGMRRRLPVSVVKCSGCNSFRYVGTIIATPCRSGFRSAVALSNSVARRSCCRVRRTSRKSHASGTTAPRCQPDILTRRLRRVLINAQTLKRSAFGGKPDILCSFRAFPLFDPQRTLLGIQSKESAGSGHCPWNLHITAKTHISAVDRAESRSTTNCSLPIRHRRSE